MCCFSRKPTHHFHHQNTSIICRYRQVVERPGDDYKLCVVLILADEENYIILLCMEK